MDQTDLHAIDDNESPVVKAIMGASLGFATGTMLGTIVATWREVPRVERLVGLPGLIRTLKMCRKYGLAFGAFGGLQLGVKQLVQNQRMKRDYINSAVGAFVAGATVFGYRGKSIRTGLTTGLKASSFFVCSGVLFDICRRTTRVDNGKECYPYTTEKRPSVN